MFKNKIFIKYKMPTHSLYLTTILPVPSPPNLNVTGGNNSAILTFSPNDTGGAEIIDYQYSIDDGATFTSMGTTTSPYTITGLTNFQSYNIQLLAVNTNGIQGQPTSSKIVIPNYGSQNYFPLLTNNTNFGDGISSLIFTPNNTTNVRYSSISSKSCVTFSNNGFFSSNAVSSLPTLLSICYWVYHIGGDDLAFSITNGTTNEIISQTLASTAMFYSVTNINGFFIGSNFLNNNWNFIVHTINATGGANSKMGLYVNGISRGLVGNTGTGLYPSYASYYYNLARSITTIPRKLNGGGIRHFMTFNKILTQTDVTNIMNATA